VRFPSAGSLVAALDTGHIPEIRPTPVDAGALIPAPIPAQPPAYSYSDDDRFPTAEELRRFNDPEVVKFRRKLAPYLFVNSVIVIATIVGKDDFFPLTILWSIYIAYKYARLWSDGYDWRDVFKQPRERELIDVADDFLEYVRALFNRDKRRQLRERNRARQIAARRSSGARQVQGIDLPGGLPMSPQAVYEAAGVHADRVRHATTDRDEIMRLVGTMPDRDRERVGDVTRSANLLHERIEALAVALSDLERNVVAGGTTALESEITRLEEQANPLDAGSEDRVRRLAYLKRQRRAVKDVQDRRDAVAAKLETCSLALRQLKLDMLRLRAGAQTHQHVTSLALQAMALAENVDSALYVADEVARVTERPERFSSPRQSARPG
jgi:serine/threonine-protein kinase